MDELNNPVLLTIAACEVGFWVLVVGGLLLRYVARLPRAGMVTLALVPVLDVVLVVAVAIDLHGGGEVGFAHRLAGIYLGCTVMFGHRMIQWLDERFAHRFAGGPAPARVPKYGPERTRTEWADFLRWLGAAAIAGALTLVLSYTVADAEQREQLSGVFGTLGVITVIWLLTGPVWVTGSRRT
ncbi:hypothetical protein NN3_38080 [Nocardia neocaledoniensis NBRC 108232]|uniref:Uncharacterized protein n=1 Tax=Nocardia neocaledoniensis TaxID=236511 RepID=A0A317NIV1_9NOCA|nr:hypothetical protein [Nocardia neocaledoniensis]PWV75251.1 hypothetical protein DFR69_105325 [Nocardia neocaledoniensis]GEM32801.1 hypothetical protein NN3_38080 [Nocardia neocaledoniensis NBRC 108232]